MTNKLQALSPIFYGVRFADCILSDFALGAFWASCYDPASWVCLRHGSPPNISAADLGAKIVPQASVQAHSCRHATQAVSCTVVDMGISENRGYPSYTQKCCICLLKEPQNGYPFYRKPPYGLGTFIIAHDSEFWAEGSDSGLELFQGLRGLPGYPKNTVRITSVLVPDTRDRGHP